MDCNSNSNKEGDGDGDKSGGRMTARAMAKKRMMAMARTVAGNKEGNNDSGKSNSDGDKGGRQAH